MKAIHFEQPGNESVLQIVDVEQPSPDSGEVRIQVAAAGVNRADLLQRRGMYPPPPGASTILGLEVAGRVAELGRGVDDFRVGDRVMALLEGGGYAEQAVVPAACVMRTPSVLDDLQAAAVPEVYLTAFLNLFQLGGLDRDRTALVHGGSGGVGTAAIQLARHAGAHMIVTAGSDQRCRRCLELGATAAVNYRSGDFVAAVRALCDGRGVDVVLDCIGAKYLKPNLEVLKTGGRLVVIGLMGGARAEIDLARLLRRRVTIIGSTLRARPASEKHEIIAAFLDRFGAALDRGALQPVIDSVLDLDQAGEAHRRLDGGKVFGKVVLRVQN